MRKRRRWPISDSIHGAILLAGLSLVWIGYYLERYVDRQAIEFNQGVQLYTTGEYAKALVAFEKSLNAYTDAEARSGWRQWAYPPRSRLFAGFSRFNSASAYREVGKLQEAYKELKLALVFCPGEGDLSDILMIAEARLHLELAHNAACNLEVALSLQPQLGEGEGKDGKSSSNEGEGQPKRAPGDKRQGTEPGQPNSVDDI